MRAESIVHQRRSVRTDHWRGYQREKPDETHWSQFTAGRPGQRHAQPPGLCAPTQCLAVTTRLCGRNEAARTAETRVPARRHRIQPDVRTGVAESASSWRKERNLDGNQVAPGAAALECVSRGQSTHRSDRSPDARHWITAVLADVTFVDDTCFSFEADNPMSVVEKASELLQIVGETFLST